MVQLSELDIRENPNLHALPLELGRIDGLRVFWFDIDPITFPQRDITMEGPRSTLKFLRLLYEASKTGRLDLSSAEYNLQSLAIPVQRFTNLTELDLARNYFPEVCTVRVERSGVRRLRFIHVHCSSFALYFKGTCILICLRSVRFFNTMTHLDECNILVCIIFNFFLMHAAPEKHCSSSTI